MTDRDALISAITAHPDEDTPRLALADYFDEHGSKDDRLRARFIRVQIEMTRTEEQHPKWRKLYAEERKLEKDLTRRGVLSPDHLKGIVGNVGYERGFLASVTVYAKRFLAEAAAFYAAEPIQTVRFAKLSAKSGSVAPAILFRSPHLAKLRALDLTNAGYFTDALGQIADSPHLAGLKKLVLVENPLTAEGVAKLIDSPNLPALESLDFSRNGLGDALAAGLARPGLRRVRAVNLFATKITSTGVRRLAECPHAIGLESLGLAEPEYSYGYDGDTIPEHTAGARALAASPHLANLKELDLMYWRIGLDGLRAIIESPHLKNLRRLRLRYCSLSSHAVKLAAEAANFRGLYLLELGIRRQNYNAPAVSEPDEDALRAALPDAAIRFE
jgi:uncharacterized protein (TIGR02996 family)